MITNLLPPFYGSQCRSSAQRHVYVYCGRYECFITDLLAENTKRAAAFMTDCNRCSSMPEIPASTELQQSPYQPPVHEARSVRHHVTMNAARCGSAGVLQNRLCQYNYIVYASANNRLKRGLATHVRIRMTLFRYYIKISFALSFCLCLLLTYSLKEENDFTASRDHMLAFNHVMSRQDSMQFVSASVRHSRCHLR